MPPRKQKQKQKQPQRQQTQRQSEHKQAQGQSVIVNIGEKKARKRKPRKKAAAASEQLPPPVVLGLPKVPPILVQQFTDPASLMPAPPLAAAQPAAQPIQQPAAQPRAQIFAEAPRQAADILRPALPAFQELVAEGPKAEPVRKPKLVIQEEDAPELEAELLVAGGGAVKEKKPRAPYKPRTQLSINQLKQGIIDTRMGYTKSRLNKFYKTREDLEALYKGLVEGKEGKI
jgi:hypothetical protein